MEIINTICSLIVVVCILITLPLSIVWFIYTFATAKSKKTPIKIFVSSVACVIVFSIICGIANNSVEYKAKKETTNSLIEETTSEQLITEETTSEEVSTEPITTKKIKLSKKEYKKSCTELFYEDIFFGNDNLENKDLKLELFVSEDMFFTDADYLSDDIGQLISDNNLYRDFIKCCVLHESKESYAGRSITVFFSKDFKLDPNDYEPGKKFTAYGKVIYWSNNTWDGYNNVYFIPKYIEKK